MTERKFKKRGHLLFRSTLFDQYLAEEYGTMSEYEKLKMRHEVGKVHSIASHIENYSLDKKLLMLSYMNKEFCLLIFEKGRGADFHDMQKIFNYYIDDKQNFLSEETRRKLNVYVIDQRQVAKHYFVGSYRFAEPVYKMAEDGAMREFITGFKSPNISISQSERTERNFDVYQMYCKLLLKGYYIDKLLEPMKFDYGHFKILVTLFCSSKPLTRDGALAKDNMFDYTLRTDPTPQRLNFLIEQGYVSKHDYADEVEGDEGVMVDKKISLYTISSKGIYTYRDIMNELTKDL